MYLFNTSNMLNICNVINALSYYFLLFPTISYYFLLFLIISAKLGTTKGSPRNTYNFFLQIACVHIPPSASGHPSPRVAFSVSRKLLCGREPRAPQL